MPLTPPKLDDRDFESLFKEARARIPRYVPEWTDWNESDPGIALLQLQTWLAETILYRLNQVPDLHYIKFLQLLGVEQRPARPAQVDLTFTLKENINDTDLLIEKGRIVGVSARDLPQPVSFETDRAFRAISARLKRVFAAGQDVTQNNNVSGRFFYPFGNPPAINKTLTLGFASKLPFSRNEIGLQFFVAEEGQALLAPQESELCGPPIVDTTHPILAWEWWDGVNWSALNVTADETASLTRSGQIYFRVPGQIPSVSASSNNSILDTSSTDVEKFYWLRARFISGIYPTPPKLQSVLTNTVRATAALTVRDEVIGSSDGTPNQVMRLRQAPVLADPPLELEVDEAGNIQRWTQVADFLASNPHDAHYTLNRATGEVRFGDGRRGRIPLAGQNNVIARTYRYGGGAIGNVGANTITDLSTPISQVESVTNSRQAQGGQDEEPLDETRLRAPNSLFKQRNRAVTLTDFEELACAAEGALVARARAYMTEDVTTHAKIINVVIVPQSSDPKPVPSEVSKRLVCRYLDERRLVTTQLKVLAPLYHDIDTYVSLTAMDDADLKTVKNMVYARLVDYFHPLRGGRDGKGWPFGRDVFYSELLSEIMRLPGVLRVDDLRLDKFLRRGATGNPENLAYFETRSAAEAALPALIAVESALATCTPTGKVIALTEPDEDTTQPTEHFYVAAVYGCCDMPVAEGALVALRTLNISVNYLRSS